MAAQSESPAEEIKRLRRCINDLISVLALSSTWTGGEPWRIIGNLMEALLSMLSLDLVYVRLRGETNTARAEMARFSPSWARQPDPQEIGERLKTWLDSGSPESPLHPSDFFGVGEIALVPLQLGLQGEMGIIFAGSRRLDFPQQTEKLILNVAANEAAIWLRGASLLSEQRRVSSELDRRVAQRTADLDASNDELQREITERKGAEERLRREETELKRSQAHKAAILDSSLDCIVAVDHEGCITEFNPAAERVLGYRREDVLGKHLADVIIPPSLRQKHRSGFARHLATGESRVLGQRLEMTALCANGREIPVEITIARIQQDGPPSFTGYLRDITSRKQNENALLEVHAKLAQSEERWRSVFESSAIGVALTDLNGQFIATNPVYQKMLGYTEEELGQLSFIDITVEEDRGLSSMLVEELLEGKHRQFQIEKQYRRKNGSLVWVRNSVSLVPGSKRVPGFLLALSEDVTRRHTVEAALDKSRSDLAHVARVSMLSALTASIAHEVNQPLSGIVTNASTCLRMLDAHPPNVEGARETARRTIRDGNRASEVVTRLRALFSKKNATLEPFDLNEAAKEVIALSLSELQRNRVILQPDYAADLPTVLGDRIQIQQVILNLIRNGSDAMSTVDDRPRELWIRTERDESGGRGSALRIQGSG